jgi:hypothetical protein
MEPDMRILTSFTANNQSTQICEIKKTRREASFYINTILAYGTFGSGSLAFYVSPDGGTTKIPLTNSPGGTGIALTANGMIGNQFGHSSSNTQTMTMWATLTGATSPSLIVLVDDNNQ